MAAAYSDLPLRLDDGYSFQPIGSDDGRHQPYSISIPDSDNDLCRVTFKMASGKIVELQVDPIVNVNTVIKRLCSLSGLSNPHAFDLIYYPLPSETAPTPAKVPPSSLSVQVRKGGKSPNLRDKLKRMSNNATYANLDEVFGGSGDKDDGNSNSSSNGPPQWSRRRKKMEELDKKWGKHSSSVVNEGIQHMDADVAFNVQGFNEAEHMLELINKRQLPAASTMNAAVTETDLLTADFERCSKQFTAGAWPCDVKKASKIASLHAHVAYGGGVMATKTSMLPKSLTEKLKEFLPPDYRKDKSAIKLSQQHFSEHSNITLDNARQLYVDLCKELPTYEAKFFAVKAPCPNKKVIMPCVLAISPRTVVHLDGNTRQVVSTWALTDVLNSMVSSSVFGIMFHDNTEFTVMTFQGEKIQQTLRSCAEEWKTREMAGYEDVNEQSTEVTPAAADDDIYSTLDSATAAPLAPTPSAVPPAPAEPLTLLATASAAAAHTEQQGTGQSDHVGLTATSLLRSTAGVISRSESSSYDSAEQEPQYDYIKGRNVQTVVTPTSNARPTPREPGSIDTDATDDCDGSLVYDVILTKDSGAARTVREFATSGITASDGGSGVAAANATTTAAVPVSQPLDTAWMTAPMTLSTPMISSNPMTSSNPINDITSQVQAPMKNARADESDTYLYVNQNADDFATPSDWVVQTQSRDSQPQVVHAAAAVTTSNQAAVVPRRPGRDATALSISRPRPSSRVFAGGQPSLLPVSSYAIPEQRQQLLSFSSSTPVASADVSDASVVPSNPAMVPPPPASSNVLANLPQQPPPPQRPHQNTGDSGLPAQSTAGTVNTVLSAGVYPLPRQQNRYDNVVPQPIPNKKTSSELSPNFSMQQTVASKTSVASSHPSSNLPPPLPPPAPHRQQVSMPLQLQFTIANPASRHAIPTAAGHGPANTASAWPSPQGSAANHQPLPPQPWQQQQPQSLRPHQPAAALHGSNPFSRT
eukprot:scpid31167/ scgid0272/ Talin-2